MVRAVSTKVGRGLCPCCHEPVMFKRTSGGKLAFECDACDWSGYAPQGSTGEATSLATIKQPAPAPAPKAEPPPAPEPAPTPPAPKPARSVFDLGQLA